MAKQIKLPESGELTEQQYEKLTTHLRNSVVWYAMNGRGTVGLIEEKLREKGVPQTPLVVNIVFDGPTEVNLWDETIQFLHDNMLIDEEAFAYRLLEKEVTKGRGKRTASSTLWQKKVNSEIAERVIEEFFSDEDNEDLLDEGLAKALRAAEASSPFRKAVAKVEAGEYAAPSPRQVVSQKMAMKGFSFDEISDYLERVDWSH